MFFLLRPLSELPAERPVVMVDAMLQPDDMSGDEEKANLHNSGPVEGGSRVPKRLEHVHCDPYDNEQDYSHQDQKHVAVGLIAALDDCDFVREPLMIQLLVERHPERSCQRSTEKENGHLRSQRRCFLLSYNMYAVSYQPDRTG